MSKQTEVELLKGAIDIHIHTAPDIVERSVDDIEAAMQAKEAGMAGIVIKSHHVITADRAKISSRITNFQVFGGITLNCWVGGLNVSAVEAAIRLGAKIVWMPTLCAENYLRNISTDTLIERLGRNYKSVKVLTDNGELVPEIYPILELISENDIAIGTGHLSAIEAKILAREAKRLGVNKIVVQHPQIYFMRYSIEDMKELVKNGAIIEHDYNVTAKTQKTQDRVSPESIAGIIKELGPENCIMATDGGQKANPPPIELFRSFIKDMLDFGLSKKDIHIMIRENPKKILGIK